MTIVKVGGRNVDLARALPLTLGDWRRLDAVGVTLAKMEVGELSPADTVALLLHVLHKADAAVTETEVEALSMADAAAIAKAMAASDAVPPDRPTSAPSTA